jgi:hypothetical protein
VWCVRAPRRPDEHVRSGVSLTLPHTRRVPVLDVQESPLNSRPPLKPANPTVEPFKHVIDEYKHRDQTITCTCGWHGSSATIDRGGSEWTAHLFEVRGKKR